MKAQIIIIGNVITMDEFKPYAEAIAVCDEKIIYVGSKEAAMKLKDDKTKILDYGILFILAFWRLTATRVLPEISC